MWRYKTFVEKYGWSNDEAVESVDCYPGTGLDIIALAVKTGKILPGTTS
jgi:hypothetical protein